MTGSDAALALAARQADPRYQRLMEATRVAAREGYDAVSMRELADKCRLSMTTIYTFCRSKDQLIAEAHLENMEGFRRRLTAMPPKGATTEERVLNVMRSFTKALDVDDALSRTLMRAMYSIDPEVAGPRSSVGTVFAAVIDAAVGDDELANRDAIIATLGHVIDSVILGWLTRRHDTAWVRRELSVGVKALFAAQPSRTPPRRRTTPAPRRRS
jgi:AcrR family transcriptional regulator